MNDSKLHIAIIAVLVYLLWRRHAYRLGTGAALGPGNSNVNTAGADSNCGCVSGPGNYSTSSLASLGQW